MKNLILTLLFLTASVSATFGQETEQVTNQDQTEKNVQTPEQDQTAEKPAPVVQPKNDFVWPSDNLTNQFKYLIEKSESYNDYKVIRKSRINDFWVIVDDSVSLFKADINKSNTTISDQESEITGLKTSIAEKEASMANTDFAMTHIRFLGMDFSKSAFITINASIIVGLLLVLGLGFFQFNHNRAIARQKVADYSKLELEFGEFRGASLEKQVKLKRELQTERNALEEIRNKTTISKKMPA